MLESAEQERFRIGITQRSVLAGVHREPRDALAQDWHTFLEIALPEVTWIPLPNIGQHIIAFAEELGLDGIIFSGGETPGTSKKRDSTEKSLLRFVFKKQIPAICVCRGMQFLVSELGQPLIPCENKAHVAVRHEIKWIKNFDFSGSPESSQDVNSFHEYGVKNTATLRKSVDVCAVSADDGTVEAIKMKNADIFGIMWHPEREACPNVSDINFFREVFRKKK